MEPNRLESQRKYRSTAKGFENTIKSKYGLTLAQWEAIRDEQSNCCAICKCAFGPKLKPCIDHCHKTGKVRGLLCKQCNQAIGLLKDSALKCRSAASYLEYHGS